MTVLADIGGMIRFFTGATLITGVEVTVLMFSAFVLACSSGKYVNVE